MIYLSTIVGYTKPFVSKKNGKTYTVVSYPVPGKNDTVGRLYGQSIVEIPNGYNIDLSKRVFVCTDRYGKEIQVDFEGYEEEVK